MNKDIMGYIPSRSETKKLEKTLEMIYNTATSKDNFDIYCVIDDDEEDLYSEVMEKFPDAIFKIVPRHERNFANIEAFNKKIVEETDYYFNWWMCDDFYGLPSGWDEKIVAKKNIFDDGYYTLFTNDPMSRNMNAATSCFRKAIHPFDGYERPLNTDPISLMIHYHEMMSLCTKKWRLAIHKMNESVGGTDQIFLNAALAHLLSKEHGYSRNIEVDFYYKGLEDSGRSLHKKYEDGLNRDQFYYRWARDENFKRILKDVEDVAQDIWLHYRNRMDQPRGRKWKPVY